MKSLVIGISGSGKSTVAQALSKLGYKSYEIDELARWENDRGEPISPPTNPGKDTYDHNHWNINKDELIKLLEVNEDVYICGSPSNLNDIFDFFDKVFLLKITESTLRHRLAQRDNNDFGKHPGELAAILSWHTAYQSDWLQRGAI